MRFRFLLAVPFIITVLVTLLPHTVRADTPDTFAFGVGYYDILIQDAPAADFRGEYRWTRSLLWELKPWFGFEFTSKSARYALAGLYLDQPLGRRWRLTPSTAVGIYGRGRGKELGYPVEFRNQIELGYAFPDGSRVALAFGHISNAGMGLRNPGTEVLTVYFHFPLRPQ
jgi:lipid A 3-O-deacylase